MQLSVSFDERIRLETAEVLHGNRHDISEHRACYKSHITTVNLIQNVMPFRLTIHWLQPLITRLNKNINTFNNGVDVIGDCQIRCIYYLRTSCRFLSRVVVGKDGDVNIAYNMSNA